MGKTLKDCLIGRTFRDDSKNMNYKIKNIYGSQITNGVLLEVQYENSRGKQYIDLTYHFDDELIEVEPEKKEIKKGGEWE